MDVTMGDDIPNLEQLPAEIIHRIALFLPCSSILRLSFSSRMLHRTCYDKVVFKRNATTLLYEEFDFARMQLDDVEVEAWELESCASEASAERSEDEIWWPDLDEDETRLNPGEEWDYSNWGPKDNGRWSGEAEEWYENWPGAATHEKLSVDEWAKIAFAVEKARGLITEREEKWDAREEEYALKDETKRYTRDWPTHEMKDWLPHLLALRHPAVFPLRPTNLQLLLWHPDMSDDGHDPYDVRNPSLPDDIAVSFSMVALFLHGMELRPAHAEFNVACQHLSTSLWKGHPGNMGMLDIILPRAIDFQWQEPEKDYDLSDVYALLLHLVLVLYPHSTVKRIPVPVLHRMPVWEVLGAPVPFRSPVEDFVQVRLSAEDMVEYLNGEWMGFNTENGEDDRYSPLEIKRLFKIHITAHEPSSPSTSSPDPDTLAIISPSSRGRDHGGAFTLSGSVSPTGNIILSKEGDNEGSQDDVIASQYRGVVTPFGIVGLWESEMMYGRRKSSKYFLGHFWIWKKEWCL